MMFSGRLAEEKFLNHMHRIGNGLYELARAIRDYTNSQHTAAERAEAMADSTRQEDTE